MRKLTTSLLILLLSLLLCTSLRANNELTHLTLNTLNDHQANLVLQFSQPVTAAPTSFTMTLDY